MIAAPYGGFGLIPAPVAFGISITVLIPVNFIPDIPEDLFKGGGNRLRLSAIPPASHCKGDRPPARRILSRRPVV